MHNRGFSLNQKGYGIPFSNLSKKEIEDIRKELTVEPLNQIGFTTDNDVQKFTVYRESSVKLYVPKYYGVCKFGLPDVDTLPQGTDINLQFQGTLRPEQETPVAAFLDACSDPKRMGGILNISCGGGKCLARDTPIMMYDGTVKLVQDICIGECLMGDDGYTRCVQSTCHGVDDMFQVVPTCEGVSPYVINSVHILSLIDIRSNKKYDISVAEYLSLKETDKHFFRGYTYSARFQEQNVIGITDNCQTTQLLDAARVSLEQCTLCASDNLDDFMLQKRMEGHLVQNTPDGIYISTQVAKGYTYPFKIRDVGKGEYFGFEIDGNRRFVLGNCVVTHNTVIGLNIISKLKKKTMIIVHKDFLLSQWKSSIENFLPGARVGTIKGPVIDVCDKDIIIGSIQSLSMKSYDKSIFQDIGFVIIDEVHRSGTLVFSQALYLTNVKYVLGLTATLIRKDGLTKVIKWFIGDVVHKHKRAGDCVHVHRVHFRDSNPDYCRDVILYNGKFNIARMIGNVTAYEPRTKQIVDEIHKHFKSSDGSRKFLVLSDRKQHLKDIARMLETLDVGLTSGFYIGGMKDAELKKSETKNVILATFAFASEGFDVPNLDTLILASPKTNIEQSVGRILRQKKEDRVNTPIVIDIIDEIPLFVRQGEKRATFFRKMKYTFINDTKSPNKDKEKEETRCKHLDT